MASIDKIWFAGNESLKADFDFKYNLENISEHLAQYQNYEKEMIQKLMSDKDFKSQPKGVEICQYCPLLAICPGSAVEVET